MKRVAGWLVLVLLITGAAAFAAKGPDVQTLQIGDRAPDFELPGVDGKNHSLKDFAKAKILAVIFTCNHCPTAQAYEERLKKIVSDYKGKGVAFVAISPNDPKAVRLDELGYTDLSDSFDEMKIRAKERKFNFPYLYDGDTESVSRAYGPVATPHVFLFDAERKLRYDGAPDDSENPAAVKTPYMRNALDALLEGKPVPIEVTGARGCSIKWSDKRESVVEGMKKLAAEPVSLDRISAESITTLLKNDSNRLRMINVWATWCGPCNQEFPEIVTINRMYRHRAFELIAISADDPEKKDDVLGFLKKREASNKNFLFDSSDKQKLIATINHKWQGGIPFTLLIRPGGEVVYTHEGLIDPIEVRRVIVQQLRSRP